MTSRWHSDLSIFAACLAGLILGAVAWLGGWRDVSAWIWAAAALPAAVPLLLRTVVALMRREAGVDVLALVSIAGALALRQELTAVVIAVMGLFLLPALPVILTATERLAGPAAGTAGAIVWMAGNLGGLTVALIVQVLVHHPLGAFIAMAAVSLLGLPLVARLALTSPTEESGREPATATAG